MTIYQPSAHRPQLPTVKASIRDMIRLQREYELPDELFWEVFNTRVLLDEPIDMDTFIHQMSIPVNRA
ncbi:MAG: hypothetical protein H7Z72_04275 [Bacteroidetes bacterium]|nr:hypothetical protein [Fibrella sp.]